MYSREMLDNSIREDLMQQGLTHVALLLDALMYFRLENTWVTVKDICGYLPFTSETLIRKALDYETAFKSRPRKTGKRGRPQLEYRVRETHFMIFYEPLNPPRRINAGWGNKITPWIDTDLIDDRAFTSVKNYRIALQREYLIRNSKNGKEWHQQSQKSMADRLGISPRTLRRYHEELKPETERVIEVERCSQWRMNNTLPDQTPDKRTQWLELELILQDNHTGQYQRIKKRAPYCKDAALWATDEGYTVYIATQRPNRYRLSA